MNYDHEPCLPYCPWRQQEDGSFDTGCGHYGVNEPEPEWTHCPYCGCELTDCAKDQAG